MITLATLAMLGSAMAHAVLSLFNKRVEDLLVYRGVFLTFVALWLSPNLFLQPLPTWEVWRFLLLGSGLFWIFNMMLVAAFNRGNMNLVYPVMRGASPALTGIVAFIFIGEPLSALSVAGLAIASLALIGFAWPEKGGLPKRAALMFALAAVVMTALYSVTDASGVRAADSLWQYLSWLFLLSGVPVAITGIVRRKERYLTLARASLKPAFILSFMGLTSYGLALYAYSIAPVAPMAALRETSIVFGAILAALVLKESFGTRRIALAICLAFGLVLLQAG